MKQLTTREVADRLGVTVQRVHQFIKDERLPAQKFGRDYIINEGDLKALDVRQTGRPPKSSPATDKRTTGEVNAGNRGSASKKKGGRK